METCEHFSLWLKFKYSMQELKSVKNLSLIAVFMAIWMVLNLFVVEVSSFLCISFEFISVFFVSAMFGPFVGAIFGFFGDLVCYFVHPIGAFFIWYAVSVMIDGLIYGLILYKNIYTPKNVVFAQISRDIITNVILNSIFIWMQFGGNFFYMLIFVRIPKNIIKIPVNCLLMILLTKVFKNVISSKNKK